MGLGTGATAAIIGGIGAAGSVAGGAIAASGAGNAASTAANASDRAAQLQYNLGEDQLAFNRQQYQNSLAMAAPWLNAGTSGVTNLQYLLGLPQPPPQVAGQTGQPAAPDVPIGTITGAGSGLPPITGNGVGGGPYSGAGGSGGGDTRYPRTAAANLSMRGAEGQAPLGIPPSLLGPENPVRIPIDSITPGVTPGTGVTTTQDGGTNQLPTTLTEASGSTVNPNLGSFGSLMQPWTQQFTAPTNVTEANDPGYQFRLQQGEDAMLRNAAATGNLNTGGTLAALGNYAQDYASNEYNNVYNRALQQYQQNYNIFQNNQANKFNRLAAISGIGQTAAGQLTSAGQGAANTGAYIAGNIGGQVGSSLQNAGAARASGYANAGNIYGNAVGSIGSGLGNAYLMSQLLQPNISNVVPDIGTYLSGFPSVGGFGG